MPTFDLDAMCDAVWAAYCNTEDAIAIGPHWFRFTGPVNRLEGWRWHMERCRAKYELRCHLREANHA